MSEPPARVPAGSTGPAPERRPGEPNPVPDADAPMRVVRDQQSLGRESFAMGAGTTGGPVGGGEGLVRRVVGLVRVVRLAVRRRGGAARKGPDGS